MKLLKDIPTKNLISIDIETVRLVEKYEDLPEDWQKGWEYKNKQSGEVPYFEELADSWEKTSSLYAEFSKVCAISVTFLSKTGDKLMCKEFWGEDENKILSDLSDLLTQFNNSSKDFRLVGHAAKYFDYPFLCKRFMINGLDTPLMLDVAHLKPWENRNLCTNQDIWRCGGSGAGSSLQAMCLAMGVPVSKVDLVGDEVGAAYFRGEFERIGTYCSYDTIATFNIIRKIKKEGIFSFNEVIYLDRAVEQGETKKEELVLEEMSPLLKIYKATNIDEETQSKIESLLKKKKMTKKDRVILEDILVSSYINNEMFKSDKEDVKDRKKQEIKDILDAVSTSK
jgi:hypothetical protein